ncbi:MAG: tRNA (N6-threonylcarbamoyladenosine(37)-N6)-methyltransferase TrmO [Aliidiomarina sp.]|uniref:tRNA (N6-threonylcarbamoyladenosine(37)-N6)-methyltransferase TrmO n=1 Tax=Aliidiomarina sp. TaxID=1872439 RepID=UPI0025C44578|nr:tRNA (N6-threonylcarbamoyladenosine(37)-N6)-methyltransferase TrmO [Aliidiomarina sp.]MCH8502058.1 tRNA (N6-threonylcarbamoyladenosine(37)-N6)-methyltransferase TrmO [Aliidiomarina sp.]
MSEHVSEQQWTIEPIGYIRSPYRQKFAIPRQPGLVKSAIGSIELVAPFDHPDCLRGIEDFSHLWLSFVFHETAAQGWKPLVRPPRLGGNAKKGVLATRSTFRPNALGLSVVELVDVQISPKPKLIVRGLDLLDGTPIIDIKPYLPYADAIPNARGGFADDRPSTGVTIEFSEAAEAGLLQAHAHPHLRQLISEVLGQDPRPGYQREQNWQKEYGMHLYHYNIKWRVQDNIATVTQVSAE